MATKVLLIEDDQDLGFLIKDTLEDTNYQCTWIKSGLEADGIYDTLEPEIILLDLMLPGLNGHQLIELIRSKNTDIPIIMISANSQLDDKITSFKLGADDYLLKPFSSEELLLKMQIFLNRKSKSNPKTQSQFQIKAFTFLPAELSLFTDTEKYLLTQRESDLLSFLLSRPNQIIPRNEILIALWGKDDYFLGRSLDVFISRLRKYFKSNPSIQINTIHGVGFKFEF